jgi:hypothetical protein
VTVLHESSHAGFARRQWRAHFGSPARLAVTLASIAVIAHSVLFAYRYFLGVAYWDFWNWIADYQRFTEGNYRLADLFKQHNEHRIVTSRLFFFADAMLFHMTGVCLVVSSYVTMLLTAIVLHRTAGSGADARCWPDPPVVFFVALLFGTCQWANLIAPFQIGFMLAIFFAVAACSTLAAAASPEFATGTAVRLALAAACLYVLDAFSMANGVLALPVLALILVLRRTRAVVAASFGVPALAATSLFFVGFHLTGHGLPDFRHGASLIGPLAAFCLGFMGSALAGWPGLPIAVAIAEICVLGAIFWHCGRGWLRTACSGGDAALLALCAYVFLCGAASALTRLWTGPQGALEPRYAALSLVLLGCVASLAWRHLIAPWGAARGRPRMRAFVAAFGAIVALALTNVPASFAGSARGLHDALAEDARALRANVAAAAPLNVMYYDPIDTIAGEIEFLRRNKLNLFARYWDPPRQVMQALRSADPRVLPPCRGAFDFAYALDASRFALNGWLASPAASRAASWIGIVTDDQRILAAIRPTTRRKDVEIALHTNAGYYGFNGTFADAGRGAAAAPALWVVGVFAAAPAVTCALAVPPSMWDIMVQKLPGTRGAPLPLAAPPAYSAFAADGDGRATGLPPPWPGAAMLSSAGAGPAGARLSYRVKWPAGDGQSMVLPYAVSNVDPGMEISVVLADGTALHAPVGFATPAQTWRSVTVPGRVIAAHGGGATVMVVDKAGGPGRWIAVSPPVSEVVDRDAGRLY